MYKPTRELLAEIEKSYPRKMDGYILCLQIEDICLSSRTISNQKPQDSRTISSPNGLHPQGSGSVKESSLFITPHKQVHIAVRPILGSPRGPRLLGDQQSLTLNVVQSFGAGVRMEPDIAQVVNKQGEHGTGAESICCFLNCIYIAFALMLFAVHNGHLPFGFELKRKRSGKISFQFSNIPQRVVLLEAQNRSG
jgi:hypothetical protein